MRTLKNRDSQMVMCVVLIPLALNMTTLAQPPDNAALLYYRACLLYEEPNQTIGWMLSDFRRGEIFSSQAITPHIEKNRHVIDLTVRAAGILKCDWGYDYSQVMDMDTPSFGPLYNIACLLAVEARWLAEQGNYTTALDRCVTLHKMALHVCDGMLTSYLVGASISNLANEAIQYVLGFIPSNVDQLNRLKTHLTQSEERFPSLGSCLTQESRSRVGVIQKGKVQPLVNMFEKSLGSYLLEPLIERIRQGDETFFERNRDYYLNATSTIVSTLESDSPYEHKSTKLDTLIEQWSEEAKSNPDATLTELFLPMRTGDYQWMIRQKTHVNALKTAIELYIVKSRMGQLPDALPADSPLDLFSGKPFIYIKNRDDFILRCQGKEKPNKDVHEYEFKVKR